MRPPYVINLHWSSGDAEIDLTAWFPAPGPNVVHLRKLLELDPDAAAEAKPVIERYIQELLVRAKVRGQSAYKMYADYRQRMADITDQLENGTFPDGLPLKPSDRKILREARNKEKRLADHAAAEQRRAYRDLKQLQRNAAAVKAWKF